MRECSIVKSKMCERGRETSARATACNDAGVKEHLPLAGGGLLVCCVQFQPHLIDPGLLLLVVVLPIALNEDQNAKIS
ncbi:uncharacterized protein BO72DRAFT_283827 [Aspergillus fijiensis CBS 313.89]|uniref:Uncharacterized protein n=1 Tax=Aspergillus fijiensis CBS 313.89 TaxID=1448319 RepID=A0A8G1W152_9EURO|nr:uncharacterized protein BO72DRAFT_283827 [Aspergillus fijiensis CBS 313.89]RAK80565.1 hypothetical protein BO72DRAFT_283827 [Aspergillus fijiensis CBS 313.89]